MHFPVNTITDFSQCTSKNNYPSFIPLLCKKCGREGRVIYSHDLCKSCYYSEKRKEQPEIYGKNYYIKKEKQIKICTIEGCNGKHVARGLCMKHYKQYKRNENKQ